MDHTFHNYFYDYGNKDVNFSIKMNNGETIEFTTDQLKDVKEDHILVSKDNRGFTVIPFCNISTMTYEENDGGSALDRMTSKALDGSFMR